MVEGFDASDVKKSAVRFDLEKRSWLKQQYLKSDDPLEIAPHFEWQLRAAGIDPAQGPDPVDVIVALRDRVPGVERDRRRDRCKQKGNQGAARGEVERDQTYGCRRERREDAGRSRSDEHVVKAGLLDEREDRGGRGDVQDQGLRLH